jgi:hypothetical protein
MKSGQEALDRIISDEWMAPIDEGWSASIEDLVSEFGTIFPDGVTMDLESRRQRRAARDLEQSLLVGILPMAMKSLDEGAVVTSVSGRWVSPLFHDGRLRLIFILPADFDTDRFRRWRRTVQAWQTGSRVAEASHARSG